MIDNTETLLQYLLKECNMSLDDVQSEIDNMNNQTYLKNHSYEIWQGNDGRWRTYFPDDTQKAGRRMIAKSTRERIAKAVIEYYKSLDETVQSKKITLRTFYQTWLDYKKLQTRSSMYIRRISSDWDNFYSDDKIIDIPLIKLDYDTLQEWALIKVKDRELTKKQYYNMTESFVKRLIMPYKRS